MNHEPATVTTCPSDEMLAGFDASDLTGEEATRIAQHLEDCANCRQRLEQHRNAAAWLDDMLIATRRSGPATGPPVPDALPSDGRDQIQALVMRGLLEAAPSLPFGAALGPFTITGYLGAGGMGIVLKAHDTKLNRTVAVKLMRPELTHDAAAVARFEREARCCGTLQHPNIVTVHSVDTVGNTRYLVMEYVDGTSLADLIRSGESLPTPRIRSIFEQITAALACAHGAGVLHRDLKSSNILIEHATDRVKIVDFGLARLMSSETRLTRTDVTVGTPEYMSPEQVRGDSPIDARTDLYSIGVVLYEMLTGCTPFRGSRASSVLHRILNEPPRNPVTISQKADPHLAAIALRLMAKRPEDRLPSTSAVLDALRERRRVPQPERRRILWRRGAVVAASLIALASVLFLLASTGPLSGSANQAITSVHVAERGSGRETAIWVRRGNRPELQRFHDFGAAAVYVQAATLVDPGRDGDKLVVAGTARALDGACVFALDQDGEFRWRYDGSWDWRWPDCAAPTPFRCFDLTAGPIEPEGEPVIVACVGDARQYACRVAIIDPQIGKSVNSFWHLGNITDIALIDRYFPDGRSAIMAIGCANKLDGFDRPRDDDPASRTDYDLVPVAMILDPQSMEGVGPPHTSRVPLKPAMPVQYVFLDVPHPSFVTADEVRRILKSDRAGEAPLPFGFEDLTIMPRADARGICELPVHLHVGAKQNVDHGFLILDRSLKLVDMSPVTGQAIANSVDYWKPLWKHVVIDGKLVEPQDQPTCCPTSQPASP